ncbi:MAG: hypothetical protein NT009_11685 [Proteobacteria bacterium]|nr:hypothetical protein [Pseudomonadota bacterium]
MNRKNYLLIFLVYLSLNLFVYYFIRQERFIYFWDSANYWDKYQDISNLFKNNFILAAKTLIHSIRHDDYNLLPVFFLIPFNFLFGNQRLAYISSILNIYALPTAISFMILLAIIISKPHDKRLFTVSSITFLTVMFFPQFFYPILFGYPDVIGVLIINIILFIYLKNPIEKQDFLTLVVTGFFLAFLIMLRRWYAYWVVSFFISLVIERLIFLFREHRFKIKYYLPSAKNIVVICAVSVISFFSIAAPIAKRMLFTNYADIYSAYKESRMATQAFMEFLSYFGLFSIFFFLLGFIQSAVSVKTRRFSLFLLIQFIITFLLFSRTQDFGIHHCYLLIPTMIIFISFSIISIYYYLVIIKHLAL